MSNLPMASRVALAHDEPMFAPHCPRHGHRVLLDSDCMTLVNTVAGIEARWRCTCGYRGVTLTGVNARRLSTEHERCA